MFISLSNREKLKLQPGEELDLLPQELLKKYIAYAQQYVHPKLSDEAKDILKKYYLDLRKHQHGNATPITNRQLEAMRRLVQVRHFFKRRKKNNQQIMNIGIKIESNLF